MAITKSGKLIGQASASEKRDHREYVNEAQRQAALQRLIQEEQDTMIACIALEGKKSFFAWYNNDDCVPAFTTYRNRIALINARIEALR